MGLTVRKALSMDCLAEAILVAGHLGLDQEIKFVNIMEVPEVVRWMKGGEFLLSSGYALSDEPQDRINLIRGMARKGIAAFGLKLGQYLKEIPHEMVKVADEVGLPLLMLPENLPYMDIMVPITEELLNLQVAQLKRYEVIHNQLLEVLLSGGDFDSLCRALSSLIDNPVIILDRNGFSLARYAGNNDLNGELLNRVVGELGSLRQSMLTYTPNRVHQLELSLDDKILSIALQPVMVNDQVDGFLVVVESNLSLNDEGLRTIEYAAPIIALVFAKEKAVFEAQRRLKGDFLEELISNTFNDEELMKKRAAYLNFNVTEPMAVFVVKFCEKYNYGGHEKEFERQKLKDLVRQKLEELFSPNTVMLQSKSSWLVGLVSVKNQEKLQDTLKLLRQTWKYVEKRKFKDSVIVGLGRPYAGVRSVIKSYQEAMTAIKAGALIKGCSQVFYFKDLGSYRFLHELRDSEDMQSFHRETIGKINRYDQQNNTNLRETLECYFANDCNLRQTAEAMHLHKNSLVYRVKKIEKITGMDLHNSEDRFNLQLGIKLDKLLD